MNKYKKSIVLVAVIIIVTIVIVCVIRADAKPTSGTSTAESALSQSDPLADADFTIHFPGAPTHAVHLQNANSANGIAPYTENIYSYSKSNDIFYAVTSSHYPPTVNVSIPAILLHAALASSSDSIGAVVSTSTLGNFGNYKALSYRSYSSKVNINVLGKYILASSTMYSVILLYRGAEPSDAASFIDSFQIK